MKLSLERKLWRWLLAVAMGAAAAAAQFYAGSQLGAGWKSNLVFSGALGAAAAAACVVRVEIKSWWSVLIELICAAFVSLFLLHYVLLQGLNLPLRQFENNMAISLAVVLLGTAISGRPGLVSALWLFFCWGFGMVDCAVMQFRGNLIALTDLYSVGTALSVADNYSFVIMPRMVTVTVVFAIVMAILLRSRTDRRSMKKWLLRAALLMLAVVTALIPALRLKATPPRNYKAEAAYYNGLLMELLAEVRLLRVEQPEGYSLDRVQQLLKEGEDAGNAATEDEDAPHVIVVMVEALSDLTAVGHFETDSPVMPFTESFIEETIHGYALSPVYAGGTSSAEWEFLTGNSSVFVPHNANVYRQYVRGEVNSVARMFGDRGYTCIAMHPYHASGWDRQRVYPLMGFEEMYFLPDLEWGETVRGLVSDRAYVDQVIRMFEDRAEGEKLFLFGVTMQNHSGYLIQDFEETVRVEGLGQDYPDVDQYLSLLQLTDRAIEDLITYFKASDEKVQIVLFGDHQPGVSRDFYAEIGMDEVQDQYIVPYFLWKNYDEDAAEMPLTSLNYLPVLMMESMKIEMPPYYRFLSNLRGTVPALNRFGCVLDGENVPVENAQGEMKAALEQLETLQYANMFDESAQPEWFVGKVG